MTEKTHKELVWDHTADIYFFFKGYLFQNKDEVDFNEKHLEYLTELMHFYRDKKKSKND